MLLRELSAFAHLGLVDRLLGWQIRLRHLVVGRDASPADRVRAVVALGGLQDAASMITAAPEPVREIRPPTRTAAPAAQWRRPR